VRIRGAERRRTCERVPTGIDRNGGDGGARGSRARERFIFGFLVLEGWLLFSELEEHGFCSSFGSRKMEDDPLSQFNSGWIKLVSVGGFHLNLYYIKSSFSFLLIINVLIAGYSIQFTVTSGSVTSVFSFLIKQHHFILYHFRIYFMGNEFKETY
jgi:hypothetical protein